VEFKERLKKITLPEHAKKVFEEEIVGKLKPRDVKRDV
jgi:hypothetical protein